MSTYFTHTQRVPGSVILILEGWKGSADFLANYNRDGTPGAFRRSDGLIDGDETVISLRPGETPCSVCTGQRHHSLFRTRNKLIYSAVAHSLLHQNEDDCNFEEGNMFLACLSEEDRSTSKEQFV